MAAAEEFEVRPSLNRFEHAVGAGALALILGATGSILTVVHAGKELGGAEVVLIGLGICGLTFGGPCGLLALYFRNYRLICGDGYFGRVTSFGRRSTWDRDQLKRVAYVELQPLALDPGVAPSEMRRSYIFISKDQRLLAEAPTSRFAQADLEELFKRLGVHPSRLTDVTVAEEAKYYRGLLRFFLRHPYWVSVVATLVMIVILIAVAVVTNPGGS